ncbi:membrane protein [Intrasporangium oryzae NRRL B-24470]|uniref:Membrane protein n=1 Tax=Intrasporangium oryzae NRRL B-24470 TaxID=1386089 RepID=W9G6U6_9MICO|nr:general stress protein [Intrasporangium oryzae]EWT00528.1 membrane protein [Intrasporangium oryzae NRRL B-24470]
MSMQPKGPGARPGFATLSLEYPLSLGVFEKYEEAQKAVDTLSDTGFPVENCLIVGTDLKQLERVTARLTWGRVALGGILSGLWLGLFVGLIFALFNPPANAMSLLLSTALVGALFGLVWSLVGYAFTRGARDFSSVSQVVATRYEVFVEHKFAQQGRQILADAGIDVATGLPGHTSGMHPGPVTQPPVPPAPTASTPSTPSGSSAPAAPAPPATVPTSPARPEDAAAPPGGDRDPS